MYDIVSLGELLIDFTECGYSPAGMRLFEQNPGGAVVNLLAAASCCGARTAFIGKVGADMHGAFLRSALKSAGISADALISDPGVFTTLAFVALSPSGERAFSFSRGADAYLSMEELPPDLLHSTRIFHTGSLSCTQEPARSATLAAIREAKAAGAVITYDPNYRASLWKSRDQAIEMMRLLVDTADIMKLSDDETELLTGAHDPEEASLILFKRGVKVVAVTSGSKGSLVRVGDAVCHIPAFKADVVDTTGAGDAYLGAFLARFLQLDTPPDGLSIEQAADCALFGSAAASLCVEKRGAIPAMPVPDAVKARIARG